MSMVILTPRRIDVDFTWVLHLYVEDQVSTDFDVISTYFLDVILLIEKSTFSPHTSIYLISMVQKSKSFPRTFSGVISVFEKTMLFPCTFFDALSMVETSRFFSIMFFDVILMVKNIRVVITYFSR